MAQAADEILKEAETVKAEIGQDDEITKDFCTGITWDDCLENKVIVIKGSILRPEFRRASHQLMIRVPMKTMRHTECLGGIER